MATVGTQTLSRNDCPTAAEIELMTAEDVRTSRDAPRDGTVIVRRDKVGSIAHNRWRTEPSLEPEEDDPHWSRIDDGDLFALVDWAPTALTAEEITELYATA